jgi:hypothetical protein
MKIVLTLGMCENDCNLENRIWKNENQENFYCEINFIVITIYNHSHSFTVHQKVVLILFSYQIFK